MSIRRGTPSIGHDEYDRPYIHWDDDPSGAFVAHADHEAAIRDCVIKVLLDLRPNLHVADLQGFYRGLTAARDAVAALPHEDGCCSKGCACQTWDKQEPCDLSCNCSFWWMPHALAAIDALRNDNV